MILINGNFLCRNLTGIERFAWEVCTKLDKIVSKEDGISLLVPKNSPTIPDLKNIPIIKSKKSIKTFPLWDLGVFAWECKKMKAEGLSFSNTAPLGKRCGFAFLHDIYAKDCPKDFTSFKDKLIRAYSLFCYKNIAKNAKKVLTVSNFTKERIIQAYGIDSSRIEVIPNGWEHFSRIESDETIFTKFPLLKEKDYFFTLGSLSKRKNLKWIVEYAKKHPEDHFAVSGKAISGLVPEEISSLKNLSNVTLLGYVSDGEVKALMQKSLSFVFPSYYEGFGIPPLEALSVGTKIIVCRSTSLPEIYGKSAHYIDVDNTDIFLKDILKEPTESEKEVLERYTYKKAAEKLLGLLKNF